MPPLNTNETIVYTARKHWFILASETIFLGALALFPSLLLYTPHLFPTAVITYFKVTLGLVGNFNLVILFLWSLELLVLVIAFYIFWTDYYLDMWYVTNIRIIAVEQRGLFSHKISTIRHEVIQDATIAVPGLIATIMRFGTVTISTASNESFKFKGAANPSRLKERILNEHHRVREMKA